MIEEKFTETKLVIGELIPGTEYTFKIVAENEFAEGSPESLSILFLKKPNAPSNFTYDTIVGQFTFNWDHEKTYANESITYTIMMSDTITSELVVIASGIE